jgi:hypothetical protein
MRKIKRQRKANARGEEWARARALSVGRAGRPTRIARWATHHLLKAILSIQEQRVMSNDYTIRYKNRFYQLLKPVYAGERGGRVVIEERLDGTTAIRHGEHYLKHREIVADKQGEAVCPMVLRRVNSLRVAHIPWTFFAAGQVLRKARPVRDE